MEFAKSVLLVSLVLLSAYAQENATGTQRAAQRNRGAQSTRDFLGLGAPPDAVAAAQGEKLYTSNCSFCHGAKANGGDTGPDLVRSALVLHDEKGELISPVIHNGRISGGMPSFASFTDAELYNLAEFLHLRVELAANRGTYKLLNIVTGDAKAGERYFRNAGNCVACHSVSGDLAHIGAKLAPADLQQAFLYPRTHADEDGAGQAGIPKVTVRLPSGESITGRLKHLDDFYVSFYDNHDDYRSVTLEPNVRVDVEDKLAAHRQLLEKYTDADMHNLTAYLTTLK